MVLVLDGHAQETTAGGAAATLSITVIGTLLAVFTADFLSHLTIHATVPTTAELKQMILISGGSLGVIVLPLVFFALAGMGAWSIVVALRACIAVLLATLVLVGFLAVRGVTLPVWQKLLVLLGELVLGAVVIGLQLASHTA